MAESRSTDSGEKLVKTLPAGAFRVLSTLLLPISPGKDWKSLADLMGFSMEEIRFFEAERDDPVLKVITKWSLLEHERATTTALVKFLRQLGRLDVIEDIQVFIDQALTLEQYKVKQQEIHSAVNTKEIDSSPATLKESYDVFISYAQTDSAFATQLLEKLEDDFHITVCIDYRDFLPGVNRLEQIVEVIVKRCRKVVVIYSPDYFDCESCDFQAKVAMSLSPGCKRRILIPVLYKACQIPTMFNSIFHLNYTDEDYRKNFWKTLVSAIKRP